MSNEPELEPLPVEEPVNEPVNEPVKEPVKEPAAAEFDDPRLRNVMMLVKQNHDTGRPLAELLPLRDHIASVVKELTASRHDPERLERAKVELKYLNHVLK
jgi:hypothetical protein